MKFLTFEKDEKWALGVLTEKGILDVEHAAYINGINNIPLSIMDLVREGKSGIVAIKQLARSINSDEAEMFLNESDITFGPCVTDPQKIICIGLNYRKHAEESGMPAPDFPILFSKFSNAIAAHRQEVKLPETVQQADYEAELAIVIGTEGRDIKEDDALSYVFGYSCANDLSARDLQFKSSQWLLGKTCDGFCPIGPYLIAADEIKDPNRLKIQAYVNGELRQNSHTSDMIFHCEEVISYVSRHMTLYPGDVILTGTPEGVAMGMPKEKREWLKDGDMVTVMIESLGSLETRIVR